MKILKVDISVLEMDINKLEENKRFVYHTFLPNFIQVCKNNKCSFLWCKLRQDRQKTFSIKRWKKADEKWNQKFRIGYFVILNCHYRPFNECSLIAQVGLKMIDIVDITCNQLENFLWCHRIIGRHPIFQCRNCPMVMN